MKVAERSMLGIDAIVMTEKKIISIEREVIVQAAHYKEILPLF